MRMCESGCAEESARFYSPFGRSNTPWVSPDARARLTCELNAASVVPPKLLLLWMYFLIA
jgi:hypothetical protein